MTLYLLKSASINVSFYTNKSKNAKFLVVTLLSQMSDIFQSHAYADSLMYLVVHKVAVAHVIARTGTLLDMFSNVHLDVPFCRCTTAPRSRSCGVQRNSWTTTFFHLHHVTQHRTRLLLKPRDVTFIA
jgi:hypothetical protein